MVSGQHINSGLLELLLLVMIGWIRDYLFIFLFASFFGGGGVISCVFDGMMLCHSNVHSDWSV